MGGIRRALAEVGGDCRGGRCGDLGAVEPGELLSQRCRDGDVADDVGALSDIELGVLLAVCEGEMRRRAVESGDLEALVHEGFEIGFDAAGVARAPYLRGQVLVCPGSKTASSAMAHKCRFVAVGDHWVWDSPDLVADEIRGRGRHSTASVSLLVAREGLELEVVSSKARGGAHERMSVEVYRLRDGELTALGQRAGRARERR